MGNKFSVVMATADLTAANGDVDWLEVVPADDKPVRLLGFILSQSSEVGDAQEEGLRFRVLNLPTTFTSGSGGTTPTAFDLKGLGATMAAAIEAGNTTVATTNGTITVAMEFAWNVRNSPYEFWFPDPDLCPTARQAAGLIVRQEPTLADTASCMATFFLEEL